MQVATSKILCLQNSYFGMHKLLWLHYYKHDQELEMSNTIPAYQREQLRQDYTLHAFWSKAAAEMKRI